MYIQREVYNRIQMERILITSNVIHKRIVGERMNYIVLDLEWNQSPAGKAYEVAEIPFEIIEIGAIKLNQELEPIDEFHSYIHPTVYPSLNEKTKSLLQINIKELEQAESFQKVSKKFLEWLGDSYLFCTWGPMDLTELQYNLDYFGIKYEMKKPLLYYDIQKLFRVYYDVERSDRSLEYAIDYFKINKNEPFHNALSDAKYTAKILMKMNWKECHQLLSVDYYHPPRVKDEEFSLPLENGIKYVTRLFSEKKDILQDREIRRIVCPICSHKVTRRMNWFSVNAKNYYCLAYCKEHGHIKGKIRIKKTKDGMYFAIKKLKLISEEEITILKEKKQILQLRKKAKKYKKTN